MCPTLSAFPDNVLVMENDSSHPAPSLLFPSSLPSCSTTSPQI